MEPLKHGGKVESERGQVPKADTASQAMEKPIFAEILAARKVFAVFTTLLGVFGLM